MILYDNFLILELDASPYVVSAIKLDRNLNEVGRIYKEIKYPKDISFFRIFHGWIKDTNIVARKGKNLVLPILNSFFDRVFKNPIPVFSIVDIDEFLSFDYSGDIIDRTGKLKEEFEINFGLVVGEY